MVLTLLPTTAFAEGGTEEPLVCTCETACTAESMNASCTVCGADGALPENCGKYAAEKSGQTGAPDNAPVITAADVQALIDALPEAETISEDNAADVEAQLEAIDEAKVQLSDEDFAVLDFTRYDAAVAALMALSGEPDKDDQKLYLVSGAVARLLTVTFEPNGGTLAEADKTRSLTTGEPYGTLPVPNYEGYDFAGWYTEQNGGTKIESDTTVTVFGTQTLYAHWTEHEYTVTVVKIGMPEWGSVTPMSTKAKAGETVTLTATPTTGNQFLEWVFLNKPEGGGWVNPVLTFTMPAEDLTIQAKFTVKNYTISYTLEGVSGGSARIVVWGDKVFKYLPQNPTYRDWVFTGWKYGDVTVTEDMTYGDLAGSDTVSSIHIIAQWHQHEFNTWTNGYPGTLKTPADCTHDAVYYWRCVCGEIEYNDNHLYEEPGTALGHLWSWTSNGNGTHTRTCRRENCNATETKDCSGGAATCTAKAICEVCKSEYGTLKAHDFTAETAEEQYLKSGSSCTEKAVYYKSCTVCGLSSKGTASEATFESGSVLGHEWGAWKSNGNVTHTRVCSRDASHTETDNCTGGTADCKNRAICETCGGEYGDLASHNFTAEIAEADYLKSDATCTEKAVYYKSCTVCGLSSKGTASEATFESGSVLGHDWGAWTQNSDEKTHTRICKRDTSHTETKNCHGGTATCTAKAVCTVCGGAYGEMAAHSFTTEKAETQYLKSAATCTEKAIYYKSCAVCGLSSEGTADEATFFSGNALDHNWGAWTSNEDGTHTRTCTVDGCSAGTQTENCIDANKDHKCDICDYIISECADDNKDHKCDYCGKKLTEHTGGKATCKDKAKCEVCGVEYGELDAKNHTNLKHFPAKTATKTTEGNIEYWYCEGCGKYFSDKGGTKEIKKADTVTAKLKDDSKSPQTGDTSNLALWLSLLFVSGCAAIGTTAVSRKKKYNR